MTNERLGLYEALQERRQTFARFIAQPDRIAVKSHRITVDCAKPEGRIVQSGPPPMPMVTPPRKRSPKEIQDALLVRVAALSEQLAAKELEVQELSAQIFPRQSVTIAQAQQAFLDLLWDAGYRVEGRRYELNDMIGPRRARAWSWPRHVCIGLVSRICRVSTPTIGRAFGGLDHTSVMFAIRRAPYRIVDRPILGDVHAKMLALFDARP